MDQERFDTLTRTVGAGMSRRGVLHTLSLGAAGGILAVLGNGTAAAKCPKAKRCGKGKHQACCKNGKTCNHGECVSPCAPDCTDKCGGVSDGCTGTCDDKCPDEPCPPYTIKSGSECVFPCAGDPCGPCNTDSGFVQCVGNPDGTHICATNLTSNSTQNCDVNGCPAGFTCYAGGGANYTCFEITMFGHQC
jgi:hypothetical protein